MSQIILKLVLCVVVLVAGTMLWTVVSVFRLLRSARADGVEITLVEFIGMRLRSRHRRGEPDPARSIIDTARRASLAGLDIPLMRIEVHALVGGDPALCVDALLAARNRGVESTWETMFALDLAGRDPLAAVEAGANINRLLGSPEYDSMFLKPDAPSHAHRNLFAR